MSDQSPPPTEIPTDRLAEIRVRAVTMAAPGDIGPMPMYSGSMYADDVTWLLAALDAVTAERAELSGALFQAHEELQQAHDLSARRMRWMGKAKMERDQARTALRDLHAWVRMPPPRSAPFRYLDDVARWIENQAPWALAGAPSGDTPPDVKEDAETLRLAGEISSPAPRDLAALADKWDSLIPINGVAGRGLTDYGKGRREASRECARELRAVLGSTDPQPTDGEPTDRIDGAEVLGYPPRPPLRDLLAGSEFEDWLRPTDPLPTDGVLAEIERMKASQDVPVPYQQVDTRGGSNSADPQPTKRVCPACERPVERTEPGEDVCTPLSCAAWTTEATWDHEAREFVPLLCDGCGKTLAEHGPLANCRPASNPDTQERSECEHWAETAGPDGNWRCDRCGRLTELIAHPDPDTQDSLDIGMRSAVGEGATGSTATTYPPPDPDTQEAER